MQLDRRKFLIGLFGAAAVVAAGPIPKAIESLSDEDFVASIKAALPRGDEVYGNGKDYAFATIQYLSEPPWVKVTIPEGYRPLREESDRLGAEAITRIRSEGKL